MPEERGEGGAGGEAPGAPRRRVRPNQDSAGTPRQARSEPAAIALRMEDLATWVMERVAKMPRDHKFTLGDRLVGACLDVVVHLLEASYQRDKLGELAAASRALVRARVLARMAERLRCLTPDQRAHFARESLEIGRMLGGWLRHARGVGPR